MTRVNMELLNVFTGEKKLLSSRFPSSPANLALSQLQSINSKKMPHSIMSISQVIPIETKNTKHAVKGHI